MLRASSGAMLFLRAWLKKTLGTRTRSPGRGLIRRQLSLEALENRLVPASLSQAGAGAALLIDLNTAGEALTIQCLSPGSYALTSTSTITAAALSPSVFTPTSATSGTLNISSASGVNVTDSASTASLTFSNSAVGFAEAWSVTLDDAASGAIAFAGSSTFAAGLTASTANGALTFAAGAQLTATGTANLSLTTGGGGLTLGNITLGTGALSVSAAGTIAQTAQTAIVSGGNVGFMIANAAGDMVLDGRNNIAGSVTVTQTNGTVVNLTLRNLHTNAAVPNLTGLSTPLVKETLLFENNAVALPATTISGQLTITAGGTISQIGALSAASASFTTIGNFDIRLNSNFNNNFTGAVAFHTPDADRLQAVNFKNGVGVVLDDSDLGMAGLFVTTQSGNITQQAGSSIVQKANAGAVTFNLLAGNLVDLDVGGTTHNIFSGDVTITGANLASVALDNGDTLASFPSLSLAQLTNLTLRFDHAPVVLPRIDTPLFTDMTVLAQGIHQIAGVGGDLVIPGVATFDAGNFPLLLTNANNDFGTIVLRNSGPNEVNVSDKNSLIVGASSVGRGPLTIKAGNTITQTGALVQQANAGATLFTTGNADVVLTAAGNDFTAAVSFSVGGNVTVTEQNDLLLGASLIAGQLTANANALIAQAPGTTMQVTGPATLQSGSRITLDNPGNQWNGAVSLVTALDATLRSDQAITLSGANVGGLLSVRAPGITQTGAIVANGADFDSGSANTTLNHSGNDFDTAGLLSPGLSLTGTGNMSLTDKDALHLGALNLGGGTLTLTTSGTVTQLASDFITQTAAGAVTFNVGPGNSINLASTANLILGDIDVHAQDVSVVNGADVKFTAGSTMTGIVALAAKGLVTLPTAALNLVSLVVTAQETAVANNISTSAGDMTFNGAVAFKNAVTLNSSSNINLNGDVSTLSPLTFVAAGQLNFHRGTWSQGSNSLTVTAAADFHIGHGVDRATLVMAGTLSMTNGDLIVENQGTFQVGTDAAVAEVATLALGTGDLTFADGSRLQVGMGPNDKLVFSGAGQVSIAAQASLSGSGLAPASPGSSVLEATVGSLFGVFARTVDGTSPRDFLMGTDIARATYSSNAVSVMAGGVESPTGTVTGVQADGDRYTVKAGTGAAAHLVVITEPSGSLAIVVRGSPAAPATTLTITTARQGGDGFTSVSGIAVNQASSVTVHAPTTNVSGDILVSGRLASLNVRDVSSGTIRALGQQNQSSSITGRVFSHVDIDLLTVLGALSLKQGNTLTLAAERFGTIKVTGDALAAIAGNLSADLVNRHASLALTSAIILGDLSGTWDLKGAVGTVINPIAVNARTTTNWRLGTEPGTAVRNGNLLGAVTGLKLGVVTDSNIHSSARVATLSATSWTRGGLEAKSWGAITLTGNLTDVDLSATLNAGGRTSLALGTLSVAGRIVDSQLSFLNGNVTSITVGRDIANSTIRALTATGVGTITRLKAAAWNTGTLDAKAVTSLQMFGNLALGLSGDLISVQVILHGLPGQTTASLGTFVALGNVTSSSFLIENGSITSFTVGRTLQNSPITLQDVTRGTIGTIRAGQWQQETVAALSIGTLQAVRVASASPLLPGDMLDSSVIAFRNSGTPGIGTLAVAGALDLGAAGVIRADTGITSFTVGRNLTSLGNGVVSASHGKIGTLKVGSWRDVDLLAETLGTVNVTGYTVAEQPAPNVFRGDLVNSNWTITVLGGGTSAATVGIVGMTLAGSFDGAQLSAAFGVTTLTVKGQVLHGSSIIVDHPRNQAAGRIGTLSMGALVGSTIRANTAGAIKTTAGANLSGDVDGSAITVTGSGISPLAVGTLSVAGSIRNGSAIRILKSLNTLNVAQSITDAALAAGTATGSSIAALTAASISGTHLTAGVLGSLNVKGNAARGIAGNVSNSLVMITAQLSTVGLGTFIVAGSVSASTINVMAGSVLSFTASRFLGSDLLVGFHMPKAADLTASPAPGDWLGNFALFSFRTTRPLNSNDIANTASFADSNVVAARLGTVTLAGIDANGLAGSDTVTFGIAFRASSQTKGTVTIAGTRITAPTPPAFFQNGRFRYGGLPN